MSLFDKIIIPLIEPSFKSIDFTPITGFIGCYTKDPDKPSQEKEFFVVFDNNKRNKYTEDLSIRLSKSFNIRKTYVKRVNNIPYYIYSFYVKSDLKKYYNGSISIETEHKNKIANFWSTLDNDVNSIFQNQILVLNTDEKLPLADYDNEMFYKKGLIVN